VEYVNPSVYPRSIDLSTGLIDKYSGFTIIQGPYHHLSPAKIAQAYVRQDITVECRRPAIGIYVLETPCSTVGFWTPFIVGPEQNGAIQIAHLDLVHVGYDDVTDTKEGEILDHFITDGAGAYD
jgi:hypothetical protein